MRIIGSILILIALAAFGLLAFAGAEEPPTREMLLALSAASVVGGPFFIGGSIFFAMGTLASILGRQYESY